jgi:hypothetical protein
MEASSDVARAAALRDVLANAATLGVEQAIEAHGALLTDAEKAMVRALSPEELQSLTVLNTDSALTSGFLDRTTNNNNNKPK